MVGNYIIAVDENGQPYIAHTFGMGSWKNKAVKYIEKIKDGNHTRYFYSQKEIDTYNANKKGSRYISQTLHSLSNPMQYEFTGNGLLSQLGRKKKKEAMDKLGNELKLIADSSSEKSSNYENNNKEKKRPTSHRKKITGSAKDYWYFRREIDASPLNDDGSYTDRGKRRAVENMQKCVEDLKYYQNLIDEDTFYHNQLIIALDDAKGLDKVAIKKNIKSIEKDIKEQQKEYDRRYENLKDDIDAFRNGTYWDMHVW